MPSRCDDETAHSVCRAHSCSLRVVVCVLVLVDVICVMIVLLIGHVAVDAILVAIFVVIFCNWRCALDTPRQ